MPGPLKIVHPKDADDGWNESGGTVSKFLLINVSFWFQYTVLWGWDPKDDADHGGYQGSCVAYPFMAASPMTPSLASCIIWITGEEAFLECVATGSWGGNSGRTSVGYWGFGLWDLESPDYPCLVTAEPIRTQLAPTGVLGQPE